MSHKCFISFKTEDSDYKQEIQEMDDLDIIELYQQSGKAHHLSEITKKQMALHDAMGVAIPK